MNKFFYIIKKSLFIIDSQDKFYFFFLSFFAFIIAILEILSFSTLYFSIQFFLNQRLELPIFFIFLEKNKIISGTNYGELFFTIFIILNLLKVSLSIICTNLIYNFNFEFKLKISNFLSKIYLKKNIVEIRNKNDSYLISNLTDRITNTGTVLLNINLFFTEIFLLVSVIIFLSFVNIKITILGVLLIFFLAIFYNLTIRKLVKKISRVRQAYNDKRLELTNYLIKGLKDIKILQKEYFIFNILKSISFKSFKTFNTIQLIQTYPRYVMESVFILSILFFYIYIGFVKKDNFTDYIPQILIFIFAVVRIIPSFNKILFYMNNTIFYYPSLEIIYREKLINKNNLLIKFNKNEKKQFQFNQVLSLENVSFSYDKNIIFNNFNYNFYKKNSYAIVGASGSGKSTLLNILLGILKVKTGFVKIDGKNIENYLENYLSIIAYIPQEFIFLEGSIKNTIIFGEQYDEKKILHLIKDLNVFKEKNIDKIKNLLNQNVKLLSLGQKQKIFIIRALYNNSDIIIFDEPTSALDKNSILELKIILKKIKKIKTLIVVTHDVEFSKNFDYIINLNKIN